MGDKILDFGDFLFLYSIASNRPVLVCSCRIHINQVVLLIKGYNRHMFPHILSLSFVHLVYRGTALCLKLTPEKFTQR